METMIITTRKTTIVDRFWGWLWRKKFERQAKRRREKLNDHIDAYIAEKRIL